MSSRTSKAKNGELANEERSIYKHKEDRLSRWASRIAANRHPNVAAVALANKTARIAWAMMKNGTDYEPNRAAA